MTDQANDTAKADPVEAPKRGELLNARDDPAWWEARNTRRRERYKADPTYRETQKASSRETYREKGTAKPLDPRENLKRLDEFGKVRKVKFPSGQEIDRWCFTKGEVAAIFGRSIKLFYHWVNDKRFPEAVLTAVDYPITRDYKKKKGVAVPQTVAVYSVEEVKAAVNALGPHLSVVVYYRTDHERERAACYEAVAAARTAIGIA